MNFQLLSWTEETTSQAIKVKAKEDLSQPPVVEVDTKEAPKATKAPDRVVTQARAILAMAAAANRTAKEAISSSAATPREKATDAVAVATTSLEANPRLADRSLSPQRSRFSQTSTR